ncbi:MAG TPA: hypothetical protein VMG12_09605 [Polyangiaceae bacterium]|nr:hypothetical protein [Polyangiaceae bacterium]
MDISLGRVLEAARERRATLTSEVAGYMILLAAQQLGAERSVVSAETVVLDETGNVRIRRDAAASEADVETTLRRLLGALIALCASPPPAIVAVAERASSDDLRALVAELSAALIPINHAAARRALARLYREARRARGHVSVPPMAERAAVPEAPIGLGELAAQALAAREPTPEAPEPTPLAADTAPSEPAELDIDVEIEAESSPTPELVEEPLAVSTEPELPLPRRHEPAQQELPQEELPLPVAAQEELPQEELPQEELPQEELPQEELPLPVAAQDELPLQEAAQPEPAQDELLLQEAAQPELPLAEVPAVGSPLAAPLIVEASPPSPLDMPLRVPRARWTESRSDVDDLLDEYLPDTRSIDRMQRVLRDMIGLDVRPSPAPRVDAAIASVPR